MIERMKAWFLAGTVGAFSPPEFTFCVDFFSSCLFHSCITAMACKRPRSICQKGKWHVTPKHAYTLDPMNLGWVDYAVQTCLWNKPTRNSSVNAHSQSSQLAEPLWTDSGLKSWICVHKSWSPLKKKNAQTGNDLSTFPPNPRMPRKGHHHNTHLKSPEQCCCFWKFCGMSPEGTTTV